MDAFVGSLIVAVLSIAVQFTLARRNVLLEFSKERQAAYTSYLEACLIWIRHVKLVRDITKSSATVTSQNPQYYVLLRTKIIEQAFAYVSLSTGGPQLSPRVTSARLKAIGKLRCELSC